MITNRALNEAIMEIQVNALLSGHDLSPFEPLSADREGEYQAACRRCGRTVWVQSTGLCYSLLQDEACPGDSATVETNSDTA